MHTAQNVLLNACSLRTFDSLTTKNGCSYMWLFTVKQRKQVNKVILKITDINAWLFKHCVYLKQLGGGGRGGSGGDTFKIDNFCLYPLPF